MNTRQKALRTGAIFIAVLIVAGLLLLYKGNDAVAIGMEKKEGILTAEQVKMSFDSVSGRLLKEAVKEGDTVKAGDVIMELDSTDTDLSIERTKAQIAQLDAQIRSMGGTQASTTRRLTRTSSRVSARSTSSVQPSRRRRPRSRTARLTTTASRRCSMPVLSRSRSSMMRRWP